MIFTIEMVEKILYPISDRPERGGEGGTIIVDKCWRKEVEERNTDTRNQI